MLTVFSLFIAVQFCFIELGIPLFSMLLTSLKPALAANAQLLPSELLTFLAYEVSPDVSITNLWSSAYVLLASHLLYSP